MKKVLIVDDEQSILTLLAFNLEKEGYHVDTALDGLEGFKMALAQSYDFIILDLSESVQGLFEILRLCSRVYTIVKEDSMAKCKVTQYEQLLSLQEYEDVKRKTAKYVLPLFRKLPVEVEQYTKGELAEYIRELLYKEEIA